MRLLLSVREAPAPIDNSRDQMALRSIHDTDYRTFGEEDGTHIYSSRDDKK